MVIFGFMFNFFVVPTWTIYLELSVSRNQSRQMVAAEYSDCRHLACDTMAQLRYVGTFDTFLSLCYVPERKGSYFAVC